MDTKERIEFIEGIRRDLMSMKDGNDKPPAQFLAEFSKQSGFDVER